VCLGDAAVEVQGYCMVQVQSMVQVQMLVLLSSEM
jgi:hypothetical protein